MASISKMQTTKDGRRFWKISVSRGHGLTPYTTRFYWPDGWGKKATQNRLNSFAGEFEQRCRSGEVLNREQQRQKEAEELAARAKLKTVKSYGESVFMPCKKLSLAETTRTQYQQMLDKYIYPEIGDTLLVEVTPAMIKKIIIDFQLAGKSISSTRTLYVVMNQLFTMAFRDDSIPISPMLKVDKPKERKDIIRKSEVSKSYSASELNYILDCLKDEPLKWQAFINLAADTGCRRGELVALQWSDINWKEKCITIERNAQYTPSKGVYITTPKSGKTRVVDIGEDTAAILTAYKEHLQKPDETEETQGEEQPEEPQPEKSPEELQAVVSFDEYRQKAENKEAEKKPLSKWCFTQDGTDDMMFPDSPTRYFKSFGVRYSIPNFHPHILRHTSASLATEFGADIASTSARLGHADISTTYRMYVHASPEGIRRAGNTVRDALKRQREKDLKKEKAAGEK